MDVCRLIDNILIYHTLSKKLKKQVVLWPKLAESFRLLARPRGEESVTAGDRKQIALLPARRNPRALREGTSIETNSFISCRGGPKGPLSTDLRRSTPLASEKSGQAAQICEISGLASLREGKIPRYLGTGSAIFPRRRLPCRPGLLAVTCCFSMSFQYNFDYRL